MDEEREREHAPLRCARCGGVIGVYEPVVHVVGAVAHRTSRAAEPGLVRAEAGTVFHVTCADADDAELISAQ
jgi:hypothetical protein